MASVDELRARGNTAFKAADYPHAIEAYTAALALAEPAHPDCAKILGNRAFCHLKIGESGDEATREAVLPLCIADCDGALLADPTFDKAIFRRLRANVLLGRREAGVEDATAFLERHPGHAETSQLGLGLGMYTVNGKLPEEDGMPYDAILMCARWAFNQRHSNDIAMVQGFDPDGDIDDFMQLPRSSLRNVNLAMMSYWESGPSGVPGTGVYDVARQMVLHGEHLDANFRRRADRDCLAWPATRVKETFIVHRLLASGTVLVTADVLSGTTPRVYVALGLGDAIHDLVYGPGQGAEATTCKTCLLPWQGRLVYDGIVEAQRLPREAATKAKCLAEKAYRTAVANGTLITQIDEEALGAAASRAAADRDPDEGCEDEEDDVDLSPEEVAIQAAVTAAGAVADLTIVFRRLGYTPETNPNKLIGYMVLKDNEPGNGNMMPGIVPMAGFAPTALEVLQMLKECAVNGRLPYCVQVDYREVIPRIKKVLGDVCQVAYYPPPTEDETAMYMEGAGPMF